MEKGTEIMLAQTAHSAAEAETAVLLADGLYAGTDLTVKFSGEIAAERFNGDAWGWIKRRIRDHNFAGIHVWDYIPFTVSENSYKARIIGMDTYLGMGDTEISHHIDWMVEELWPVCHAINKADYNNGSSAAQNPWKACDGYFWLNNLMGSVPNGTGPNPAMASVNYLASGVFSTLPQKLKNVIAEKRMLVPKRHSSSALLAQATDWGWETIGRLWLPTECEVFGYPVWADQAYEKGCSVQYAAFAGSGARRVKRVGNTRTPWWLLSAYAAEGDTQADWTVVTANGQIGHIPASSDTVAMPICFRIT